MRHFDKRTIDICRQKITEVFDEQLDSLTTEPNDVHVALAKLYLLGLKTETDNVLRHIFTNEEDTHDKTS